MITVRNVGDSPIDSNSIVIKDPLPTDIIYNNGVPVTFANGTTPSGLAAFNPSTMVRYSSKSSGLDPYTYTPVTSPDALIRGVRVIPSGTMAASNGTVIPEFLVTFDTLVK